METICSNTCPLVNISWLWYVVAVIASFMVGWLWYGVLFTKQWIKAVKYQCQCGADMAKGDKCTCKTDGKAFLPMIMQLIATALVALMYFILTPMSVWLAIVVIIAMSGWMKTMLKFQIPEWKRFFTLAAIDVGYFAVVSTICILFALI